MTHHQTSIWSPSGICWITTWSLVLFVQILSGVSYHAVFIYEQDLTPNSWNLYLMTDAEYNNCVGGSCLGPVASSNPTGWYYTLIYYKIGIVLTWDRLLSLFKKLGCTTKLLLGDDIDVGPLVNIDCYNLVTL